MSQPSRYSPHPLNPPLCPPALQAALQAHDWQLEAAANALLNQQRGAAAGPAPGRSAPPVQQQSLGSPVLRGAGGSTPRSPANGKSPSGKGLARVSAAAASPVWQVLGQEFCIVAPAAVAAEGLLLRWLTGSSGPAPCSLADSPWASTWSR